MLLSATELFTGDALHWYRATKVKITDWRSLLANLKDDFDVADFDYRMSADIRSRTQGDNESVAIYFDIMEGMFGRLNQPMYEADKLEILLHNIRPCFSTIIAASNVGTVDDLKIACRNYERVKVRSDNFKEPPSASSGTLAPEFSFNRRREVSKNFNNNTNSNFERSRYNNNFDGYKSSQTPRNPGFNLRTAPISQVYCYRCKLTTHSIRDCPAERSIFCFHCGKKDVRRPDCPNCSTSASKN